MTVYWAFAQGGEEQTSFCGLVIWRQTSMCAWQTCTLTNRWVFCSMQTFIQLTFENIFSLTLNSAFLWDVYWFPVLVSLGFPVSSCLIFHVSLQTLFQLSSVFSKYNVYYQFHMECSVCVRMFFSSVFLYSKQNLQLCTRHSVGWHTLPPTVNQWYNNSMFWILYFIVSLDCLFHLFKTLSSIVTVGYYRP